MKMGKQQISMNIDKDFLQMLKYFKQMCILEFDEEMTVTKIFKLGAEIYIKEKLREYREPVLKVPTSLTEVTPDDVYDEVLVKIPNYKLKNDFAFRLKANKFGNLKLL